ncbi:MAG TPA: alpha/beta hydrolase [Gemmatimonadaceae bacterium]
MIATHVTSSDGTPIAVWRSGSGPSLILVHGTTADHTRWERVRPGFEAHFTIHAVDRRGRGGSGDANTYSIAQEGLDIAAVAAEAQGPVSLLGHSYGAICSLEAALLLNLNALVLYEPPLPIGVRIAQSETLARLDELIAGDQREEALLAFFREVVRVPEPLLDLMRAQPAWRARVAAAHTVAREARLESTYQPDLDRFRAIQAPTLLLLGGDSPDSFREATTRLNAIIPNSRIHEMPGQHHVAMDTIPDAFVRIVTEFLRDSTSK